MTYDIFFILLIVALFIAIASSRSTMGFLLLMMQSTKWFTSPHLSYSPVFKLCHKGNGCVLFEIGSVTHGERDNFRCFIYRR